MLAIGEPGFLVWQAVQLWVTLTQVAFALVTRGRFLTSASKFNIEPNGGLFDVSPETDRASLNVKTPFRRNPVCAHAYFPHPPRTSRKRVPLQMETQARPKKSIGCLYPFGALQDNLSLVYTGELMMEVEGY